MGTAISSEFVYLLGPGAITPDPKHFGVFYLKQSYAEDVFDFKGAANQVLGPARRAAAGGSPARCSAGPRTCWPPTACSPPRRWTTRSRTVPQPGDQGLRSFAVITPTIFLAVAALVLNVLLTRLAEQQRTVDRHAQGPGLLRRADLLALPEVRPGRGPGRRAAGLRGWATGWPTA